MMFLVREGWGSCFRAAEIFSNTLLSNNISRERKVTGQSVIGKLESPLYDNINLKCTIFESDL